MRKLAKIQDYKDYARDLDTGAVLLHSREPISAYEQKRNEKLAEKRRFNAMSEELRALRALVTDLQEAIKRIKD